MIRILVNGSHGKMGLLATQTLTQSGEFTVFERGSKDAALADVIQMTQAEVVLDLTRADLAYTHANTILACGAHPVMGTSGLSVKEVTVLTEIAREKQIGGIIAPNFSIAAVLMMQFAATAVQYFPDVEIFEAHHPQKRDAPSGTAQKTAEMLAASRLKTPNPWTGEELLPGVRGGSHAHIPIHSSRLPGIIANQTVLFGGLGETLSISHQTLDRQAFMPGVLLCCQRVMALDTLYYGMEHVL